MNCSCLWPRCRAALTHKQEMKVKHETCVGVPRCQEAVRLALMGLAQWVAYVFVCVNVCVWVCVDVCSTSQVIKERLKLLSDILPLRLCHGKRWNRRGFGVEFFCGTINTVIDGVSVSASCPSWGVITEVEDPCLYRSLIPVWLTSDCDVYWNSAKLSVI